MTSNDSPSIFAWGVGWDGGLASMRGELPVLLALIQWTFAVRYHRHGCPVPTRARANGAMTVLQVPKAWGKLFRDELQLDPSSVEQVKGPLTVRGPVEVLDEAVG
jgi:hypothetical protein